MGDPEGGQGVRTPHTGNFHEVAIGVHRKSGTDHPRDAMDPSGQIAFRGGLYGPL